MEKKPKLPEGIAGRYRTLANQEIGYSEEEMKSLFKMFRDGGRALTVTHLLRLITVKDRKKRSKLVEQTMKHNWSTDQLRREVLVIMGRRNPGGRHPQILTNDDAAKRSIEEGLNTWVRCVEYQLANNRTIGPELEKQMVSLKKQVTDAYKLCCEELGDS